MHGPSDEMESPYASNGSDGGSVSPSSSPRSPFDWSSPHPISPGSPCIHATESLDLSPPSPLRPSTPSQPPPVVQGDFALLEMAPQVFPGIIQPIRLYFHQQWESPGPIILYFRDGVIKRLSSSIEANATPCVKVEQSLDLSDNSRPPSPQDESTRLGSSEDDSSSWKFFGGSNSAYSIANFSPFIFISLTILALALSQQMIVPSMVPFPIHQPITELVELLDPIRNPTKSVIEDIHAFDLRMVSACTGPASWARANKDDVPESGGLWDRDLWSTVDDGEEDWRYTGAGKDDMRAMASKCAELRKGFIELHSLLYNANRALVEDTVRSLDWFLTSLLTSLGATVDRTSMLVPIEDAGGATASYLEALEEKQEQVRIVEERVLDVDQAQLPAKARKYTRRNLGAWKVLRYSQLTDETIGQTISHLTDRLDRAIQKLESLEVSAKGLKDDMARFQEPGKRSHRSVKKTGSAPLQDIMVLSQTTRSLKHYNQQLRASLRRITSLHAGLQQIALYHGDLKEPPTKANVDGLDFWPLIWIAFGFGDVNVTAAHKWSKKSPLGCFGTMSRLPLFLRPRLGLAVPAEATQIQALTQAQSRLQEQSRKNNGQGRQL